MDFILNDMKNLWRVFSRGCVCVCVDLSFLRITVNPWTTWISTMWVHSHVEIFNSKYYSNTWSTAGWICGRGTTDTQVQRNWEHTGPGACGNVEVMNMWMVYQALEMNDVSQNWMKTEKRVKDWALNTPTCKGQENKEVNYECDAPEVKSSVWGGRNKLCQIVLLSITMKNNNWLELSMWITEKQSKDGSLPVLISVQFSCSVVSDSLQPHES